MQALAREQMRKAMSDLEAQSPATPMNATPARRNRSRQESESGGSTASPADDGDCARGTETRHAAAGRGATTSNARTGSSAPPAMPRRHAAARSRKHSEQPKPVAVAKKKAPPSKATGFSQFTPIVESPNMEKPAGDAGHSGDSPVMTPGKELKRADERKAREEVRKDPG